MGNLTTVYNNLLSAYTPNQLTRYDTHKSSDLKNVYSSIVKLNKESPWYLPTTSADTKQYAVSLKESARKLHNTIAELGGLEEDGLLSTKNAYSSDEEIATVTYIGKEAPDTHVPSHELSVLSLATGQENLGMFLVGSEPTALTPSTYSFDIAVGDMNYEFQFSVSEGDTNRALQDRLAKLVTNADIGIEADVLTSGDTSALRLVSEATGSGQTGGELFHVDDEHTSKKRGAVSYLGLDYINHPASDASFTIDGEEYSASDNHFTISKRFSVQLHGVTGEDRSVRIGLKTDTESITDNVIRLAGGYNDFLKAASSYLETQNKSRSLVREMRGIVSHFGGDLESLGIRMEENGTLSVDSSLLERTASESDDITEAFAPVLRFSDALLKKSNRIALNPMDYVDRKIVAYKNPGHNFASPYTTSAYSGMLFSGYC